MMRPGASLAIRPGCIAPSGPASPVGGDLRSGSEVVDVVVAIDSASVAPRPGDAFIPVEIATIRCKGCGLCIEVCAPRALAPGTGAVNGLGYHPVELVDPAACTSCAKCARVCPEAGLTIYARPRGTRGTR